jgi:hypothetical protein
MSEGVIRRGKARRWKRTMGMGTSEREREDTSG